STRRSGGPLRTDDSATGPRPDHARVIPCPRFTATLKESRMRRFTLKPLLALLAAGSVLVAQAPAFAASPAPASRPETRGEWPRHGLDAAETRFSPLSAISADNVGRLGLAWHFRFDRP